MGPLTREEKEQVVRTMYEAATRGDLKEALTQIHPEMELRLAVESVESVVGGSRRELRGHEGFIKFFELLDASWEEFRVEIKEAVDGADDRLISFETWTVRGGQGIEVETGSSTSTDSGMG